MYPYASLATIACVALYNATVLGVGAARRKHGVSAPATDGPPDFQVRLRVQMNTLEQLAVALPAIWLCAIWVGDGWAGLGGGAWFVGRALYARAYVAAPSKRGPGFILAMLATTAMLLAATLAAIAHLI
ncbi:MAG: MAPEG family protein [Tagaea sp.]